MTDTEINAAIAEACGWKWYRLPVMKSDGRTYRCLFVPSVLLFDGKMPEGFAIADMTERVCNWEYMHREGLVPNYVSDLNAMHEAEEWLFQQGLTTVQKWACVFRDDDQLALGEEERLHATARQRAEAFLRTVGKWRDA